jgi:hypothetical protein
MQIFLGVANPNGSLTSAPDNEEIRFIISYK